MKKTLLRLKLKLLITPQSSLSKTLLFMKMTVLLILLTTLQAVAGDANAQIVTIQMNQVFMPTVFKAIEKQSEFRFLYNYDLAALQKKINVNLEGKTVPTLLDNILLGTGLIYKQLENNLIVIIPSESSEFFEDRKITGTIKDDAGKAVSGASVYIKNKSTGTTTNASGQFTIIGEVGQTIVIQAVNYETLEVVIANQKSFDFVLKSSISNLEEVVVVGYGTQKKGNATGSIFTVSKEQLENRPVSNVQQALQGLVPNLVILPSNAGGEPGANMSMNLRGLQSFGGSSEPYVLVDNIPQGINDIDPNDIQSITVLKDAASAAIYGARAAYGVILITTKSGKDNRTGVNVSYSVNTAWSAPLNVPRSVATMDFALAMNDAAINQGLNPYYNADALSRLAQNIAKPGTAPEMFGKPDGLSWDIGTMGLGAAANNDWRKILFNDYAFNQKHNLNVSGSSGKIDYYFSAGFYGENGLLRYGNEYSDRYNFDAKVNAQVTSWAKFTTLFKFYNNVQDFPWDNGGLGRGRIYDMMQKLKPTMPLKYAGTDIFTSESGIGKLQAQRDKLNTRQFVVSPRITLEPIKGWITNAELNYTQNDNFQSFTVVPFKTVLPNGDILLNPLQAGTTYAPTMSSDKYLSPNIYSTYSKSFGKHNLTAMAGYQQETYNYMSLTSNASYLLSSDIPSVSTAVGVKTTADGLGHWATQSAFGRLNYNYDEKYLLEANLRTDGSSRFVSDKRWGTFPSVSAGWVFSKEKFFPLKKVVDFLKIRASYGTLGNQNVANYLYIPTMGIANTNWLFANQSLWQVSAPNINSINLTWEKVSTKDIGIDFRLFNNRLSGTFDYYESPTTNLVGPGEALPSVLGTAVPRQNGGELLTKGYELALNWKDRIGNFSYEVGASLGDNQSKVTKYSNPTSLLSTYYVGQNIGEIWGYQLDGLFQSAADVTKWGIDQSFIWPSGFGPGDPKYVDQNGDKKIGIGTNTLADHGDKIVIGNNTPRYIYAFNSRVSWKGFDLSVFFQGIGRRQLFVMSMNNGNPYRGASQGPLHAEVWEGQLDYWRDATSPLGANPNAFYPKPYSAFTGQNDKAYANPTDRYLENGAYLRLKNVQLGYVIPKNILNKVNISNAKIYISGENLYTFASSRLFDPEASGGRQGNGKEYPLSKRYSIGFTINF